jgi:DNA-binding SARP family transcriptional activator
MRLQAGLGRPNAVRRTYRLLARQLAELDVDPEPETEQLVADLLRRPAPDSGLWVARPAPSARPVSFPDHAMSTAAVPL